MKISNNCLICNKTNPFIKIINLDKYICKKCLFFLQKENIFFIFLDIKNNSNIKINIKDYLLFIKYFYSIYNNLIAKKPINLNDFLIKKIQEMLKKYAPNDYFGEIKQKTNLMHINKILNLNEQELLKDFSNISSGFICDFESLEIIFNIILKEFNVPKDFNDLYDAFYNHFFKNFENFKEQNFKKLLNDKRDTFVQDLSLEFLRNIGDFYKKTIFTFINNGSGMMKNFFNLLNKFSDNLINPKLKHTVEANIIQIKKQNSEGQQNPETNQNKNTKSGANAEQLKNSQLKKFLQKFFDHKYFLKVINYVKMIVKGHDNIIQNIVFQIFQHYMNIYNLKFSDTKTSDLLQKNNILIKGDSGIGKTLLCKVIANYIEVPYIIADCSALTIQGFVGEDPESSIIKLFKDNNRDLAEIGIVIFDEFDKLASVNNNSNIMISTTGVQYSLLKIMEGTMVNTKPKNYIQFNVIKNSDKYVNTQNILFIALGVFPGLNAKNLNLLNILKLSNNKTNKSTNIKDILRKISNSEKLLNSFGIINELIGRFNVLINLNNLTKEDYKKILLESKISPLIQFRQYFSYFNLNMIIKSDVINLLINQSFDSKCNVRSLFKTVNKIFESIQIKVFLQNKICNNKKNIEFFLDNDQIAYLIK